MKQHYWFGVLLILLGCAFLFGDMFGYSFGSIVSTWWPLIFVAMGVSHIIRKPEKLTGGLFFIALGTLLIADDIYDIDFFALAAPLALIIFGIGFPTREKERKHEFRFHSSARAHCSANSNGEITDEVIDISALFSGSSNRVITSKFRGGKISCTFSGVELDLRGAQMASSEASIDVDCTFGGVEIKVPQAWRVVVVGSPIFGGVENDTMPNLADSTSVLTIRATVMFGGLEVKN